jgi:hypothetical protein
LHIEVPEIPQEESDRYAMTLKAKCVAARYIEIP